MCADSEKNSECQISIENFLLQRREEEHQKELERIKAEKELEVARLRAQQERAKDKQAERVSAVLPVWMRGDSAAILNEPLTILS